MPAKTFEIHFPAQPAAPAAAAGTAAARFTVHVKEDKHGRMEQEIPYLLQTFASDIVKEWKTLLSGYASGKFEVLISPTRRMMFRMPVPGDPPCNCVLFHVDMTREQISAQQHQRLTPVQVPPEDEHKQAPGLPVAAAAGTGPAAPHQAPAISAAALAAQVADAQRRAAALVAAHRARSTT